MYECNEAPILSEGFPVNPAPPQLHGPLVMYQALGGRPSPYYELPVLIYFRNFLEPGTAPFLAQGPLDGALQRRIAEQATNSVMARGSVVPMVGPWLEQYLLQPRCPFTGATSLFSHVDQGTHPPNRASHLYSRARPSVYICLTAPPYGASFYTPGYPIGVTQMQPGDAVLCHSVADECFNSGSDEAVFLRLYGDLGPHYPHLPVDQTVNPLLVLPPRLSVEAPPSPLAEQAHSADEDIFAPKSKELDVRELEAKMRVRTSQAVLTEAREALKEKGRNTARPKPRAATQKAEGGALLGGGAPVFGTGKAPSAGRKNKKKSQGGAGGSLGGAVRVSGGGALLERWEDNPFVGHGGGPSSTGKAPASGQTKVHKPVYMDGGQGGGEDGDGQEAESSRAGRVGGMSPSTSGGRKGPTASPLRIITRQSNPRTASDDSDQAAGDDAQPAGKKLRA